MEICNHDWAKALAPSGMYFFNKCRHCGDREPYVTFPITDEIKERLAKGMLETKMTGEAVVIITAEEINNLEGCYEHE